MILAEDISQERERLFRTSGLRSLSIGLPPRTRLKSGISLSGLRRAQLLGRVERLRQIGRGEDVWCIYVHCTMPNR